MSSSPTHLWLVGNSGHLPAGNPAKVVASAGKPAGFGFTSDLGPASQSKAQLVQKLASAIVNLPNGIAVPTGNLAVPGFGNIKIGGAGGSAGGLDSAVTTAGNVATGALTLAQLFTSVDFWKGVGLCVAGGGLVLLGLLQLTGHGTPSPVSLAAAVPK